MHTSMGFKISLAIITSEYIVYNLAYHLDLLFSSVMYMMYTHFISKGFSFTFTTFLALKFIVFYPALYVTHLHSHKDVK